LPAFGVPSLHGDGSAALDLSYGATAGVAARQAIALPLCSRRDVL